MAAWYLNYGNGSSTGYYAVAQWQANHVYAAGSIVRQLTTPAVGSERCFKTTAGLTSGASEPATWTLTKAGTTADNGGTWTECSGNSTQNWNAPLARLSQAFSWAAAGDSIYIASASAETQATSITFSSPGTSTNPVKVICVNAAGSVPPVGADVTTGGSVTVTGNTGITFTTGGGSTYYNGITFNVGTSTNGVGVSFEMGGNGRNVITEFDNCALVMVGTATGNQIGASASGFNGNNALVLKNTTVSFSAVGQGFVISLMDIYWYDTPNAVAGAAHPTVLFIGGSFPGNIYCEGVDLSSVTGTIFSAAQTKNTLVNCKYNASATIQTRPTYYFQRCNVVISDSGATGYNQSVIDLTGTLTPETTDVRSGGASDGVTPISWKVVTTANALPSLPFACFPIPKWAASGSPITASVAMMNDGTTLTNADIWIECQVLDSAGAPVSALYTSGLANPLSTAANVPTDGTSTWTTTGIGSPIKQVASVTFTPAIAGYVRCTVKVAKTSKTIYIDPLLQGF